MINTIKLIACGGAAYTWRLGLVIGILALSLSSRLHAQDSDPGYQLWLEYNMDVLNGSLWKVDTEFDFNQDFDEWREFTFNPMAEFYYLRHLDILAGATFAFTNQTDTLDSFEFRPTLGIRYNFTPEKRFFFRIRIQYEYRIFTYFPEKVHDTSNRLRLRFELRTSLTTNDYHSPRNVYLITDVEFFNNLQEPAERYMYRDRISLGVGYKYSPRWTFSAVLIRQGSKNTIDGSFSDNLDYITEFQVSYRPEGHKKNEKE